MHYAPIENNPYLRDVHAALPRVFALFDANPLSPLRGVGDRYRWAWKGIDFANGTYQGAVHGLALLVRHDLLPEGIARETVIARIHTILRGIRPITRANGSLDEILPWESSYCVTALVLFDALCALDALGEAVTLAQHAEHLVTLKPLAEFLLQTSESHGIITNHLAVAAAALVRWQKYSKQDTGNACRDIMAVIMAHRSSEGWFSEYGGADPGYQTLALDYLADLNTQAPTLNLAPLLDECCAFLSHAAHPNGSFGGVYGSRNTRFAYPAGIEWLAQTSPAAAALAGFLRGAHAKRTVVGLVAMDDANLIPMFTSFCRAAVNHAHAHAAAMLLPHASAEPFQRRFPQAGWIVTRNAKSYSIVNQRKAAVMVDDGVQHIQDGGVCARNSVQHYFTSQLAGDAATLASATPEQMVLEVPLQRFRPAYPSPVQTIILRLLCLTVMRIPVLNACVKKLLVWLLISRNAQSGNRVRRTITLVPTLTIADNWIASPDQLTLLPAPMLFHAVHMASQGYWQHGDDQ